MSDPTADARDAGATGGGDAEAAPNEPTEDEPGLEDEPPDESELMGRGGVEHEVLAELARVESELADTDAPAGAEGEEGAQV